MVPALMELAYTWRAHAWEGTYMEDTYKGVNSYRTHGRWGRISDGHKLLSDSVNDSDRPFSLFYPPKKVLSGSKTFLGTDPSEFSGSYGSSAPEAPTHTNTHTCTHTYIHSHIQAHAQALGWAT